MNQHSYYQISNTTMSIKNACFQMSRIHTDMYRGLPYEACICVWHLPARVHHNVMHGKLLQMNKIKFN